MKFIKMGRKMMHFHVGIEIQISISWFEWTRSQNDKFSDDFTHFSKKSIKMGRKITNFHVGIEIQISFSWFEWT